MLLAALMAAPSLTDGNLAAVGLPYVMTAVLGTFWGKVLLVDVAIAIFVCTLAIQTAGSRLVFSMARDGRLPASKHLAHVDPRRGTPVWPSVAIGVLAVAMLAVNIGNAALFTTLSSVCIVLIYLAYLLVSVPMLVARLRDHVEPAGPGLFSLGRWGVPVNVLAVLYGAAMVVNLAWPRSAVYDPTGEHPWLRFSAPAVVVVVLLLGLLTRSVATRTRVAAGTAETAPTTYPRAALETS
jgi:urea carboxylase system permease